jgi:hypothetical protein
MADADEIAKELRWWKEDVTALVARMEATPSENIDDQEALAAFIWITTLARHGLSLDRDGAPLTVDQGAAKMTFGPWLASLASEQIEVMRARLAPRWWR